MFVKSRMRPTTLFHTYFYYSTATKHGFNLRRKLEKVKRQENTDIFKKLLTNITIESPKDVDLIRCSVLNSKGNLSEKNVDRILLNHFCIEGQYRNGINYIEFLNEEIKSKSNLFLNNQLFKMYFYERHKRKTLSAAEEEYLISLYKDLRKSFPVLDIISIECAILGLSLTKEWKKCLHLLQEVTKIDRPSSICYSAIIASAFLNGEEGVAWKLLQEMLDKGRVPYDVAFSAFIEKLGQMNNNKEIINQLEKLINECKEKDLIFSEEVIEELKKVLKRHLIQTNVSSINHRGCCSRCQKKLEKFEVTDDMFEKLKEKIIANVIVGKNIFSKTTPEEFIRFQNFLTTTDNCSVVIDGLNVAYSVGTKHSTNVSSAFLAHVVAYFINRNMKVVVLGREHMTNWPSKNWSYIKNNAEIFLTQNISQDDPYLIYTALHLGKNTIIVTKDLMRSHLFLLREPRDKIIFSRWLSQRQYQVKYVGGFGKVFFEFPLPYMRTMQKNGSYLHIPYKTKEEKNNESCDVSSSWLCIQCDWIKI